MLKAKLDSVRKNKKGFSLVELIIVIAIMVALIAVMAPAFVKYVQKSRDAALATAAEDYEKAVQTYVGDPDTQTLPATGSILIKVVARDGKNYLDISSTTYDADLLGQFNALAGADTSKAMGKTDKTYTINITNNNGDIAVKMVEGTQAGG